MSQFTTQAVIFPYEQSICISHKGLESKLEILIYMQDQYLSATSNVNLSPTSHNIKIVFKCEH